MVINFNGLGQCTICMFKGAPVWGPNRESKNLSILSYTELEINNIVGLDIKI